MRSETTVITGLRERWWGTLSTRGRGTVASRRRHVEARCRQRQGYFLFVHVFLDRLEQRSRQVPFAGIGEHAEDHGIRLGLLGDLHRDRERRSAGDAGEDALLLRQLPRPFHADRTGDRDQVVVVVLVDRFLQDQRDEV